MAAELYSSGSIDFVELKDLLRYSGGVAVEIDGARHRLGHFGLTPGTICRSHRFTSQSDVPRELASDDIDCLGCRIVERAGGIEVRKGGTKRWWPGGRGAHAYANGAGR